MRSDNIACTNLVVKLMSEVIHFYLGTNDAT